jgi:hypothetical protein
MYIHSISWRILLDPMRLIRLSPSGHHHHLHTGTPGGTPRNPLNFNIKIKDIAVKSERRRDKDGTCDQTGLWTREAPLSADYP